MSEIVCECGHSIDIHEDGYGCMIRMDAGAPFKYCTCGEYQPEIYRTRIENLELENEKLRKEVLECRVANEEFLKQLLPKGYK